MKLLFRFTLVLFAALCLVLTGAAYVSVTTKRQVFDQDMVNDHHQIGQVLASAAARAWEVNGADGARSLVQETSGPEHRISLHWLALAAPSREPPPYDLPAGVHDQVAHGEIVSIRIPHPGHGTFLHTFVPVVSGGGVRGVVELAESFADERAFVRSAIEQAIGTTLSMAAVTAFLAALLGSLFVGRPMSSLIEKARRVGTGDLSGPLELERPDEFAVLAREMNLMCERLSDARDALAAETRDRLTTLEQLRHADRLSTVGKLAAGVAHELGTPLNVVSGRARMIQSSAGAEASVAEHARIIDDQVKRITRIIRQLLDFARRRGPQRTSTDLGSLVERVVGMVGPMAKRFGVDIEAPNGEPAVEAPVDAAQIEQVLTNVVVNGIQAMPQGGHLAVRLARVRATPPPDQAGPEAGYVRVCVEDHGVGISADNLPHVFEPFFTTKDVGEGTGLGLSVSYGIVHDHGGWIEVESEERRGTRVSIFLPEGASA